MLPTFVIGLREGVEASLIVGIIAAFLRQRGATRQLRWVWTGVAAAVVLCAGIGVLLEVLDENLPQRQQEGLETVIAVVAVAMVTSMVVWMARHARSIKGDLETRAEAAVAGSVWAMAAMAFLAVLREGMETAVFLLSAFQASTNRSASSAGAVLGLIVAVGIGYALYRGGVRINLARFFTATGLVLVLVAAGLVAFAMHTGHEAGWIQFGQAQVVDLRWLIKPGSVQAALFTGVLGIQPRPALIEVVAWLAYLVPVTVFVVRSSRRRPAPGPRGITPAAA
ncbi:MAG TPA: iron uptake transporter permease EfeU [Acidimicrobiales bacterium]|nr:iron uptake transporter permease EfeU [Acidimicrobiales bacterium]